MAVVAKEQRHATKSPAVKKSGRVRKVPLSPVFILELSVHASTLIDSFDTLFSDLLPTLLLPGSGEGYERRPQGKGAQHPAVLTSRAVEKPQVQVCVLYVYYGEGGGGEGGGSV